MVGQGGGVDNFSFGTDAWSLPTRLFREGLDETPFSVAKTPGCVMRLTRGDAANGHEDCAIQYEDFELRHHKVGLSERDDIARSFPNGASAASQIHEGQLSIPFHDFDFGYQRDRNVILAYMANPEDGLCAVYLTTIRETCRGRISGWSYVERVWLRSEDDLLASEGYEIPGPEQAPTPQISRVRRHDRNVGNDEALSLSERGRDQA